MSAPDLAEIASVVVGTDLTPAAERAVQRAAALALEHGTKVMVVHVGSTVPRALLRRLAGSSAPPGKERVNRLVERMRSDGIRASGRYMEGRVVHELVGAARSVGAGLLVVGARGRALADEILGSTAERLVHAARCPVLVVRGSRGPYRRVLAAVAIDHGVSPVLAAARALAPDARLDLLHVYQVLFEPTLVLAGVDATAISDHRRTIRREARVALERVLARAPVRPHDVMLQNGDPRVEVARLAHRGRYDLVVLARRRSRVQHWLFDSVTRSVLRDARADVLLI